MAFKPSLRLQTKLTFVLFLPVIVMVAIFIFLAIEVYEAEERIAFELRASSLASLLGESATNAIYDLRFDQVRSLLRNVLEQDHVLYVYAYDKHGRILADGTQTNRYFNTILSDPVHSKAIRAEKLLLQYKSFDEAFQATGNVLDIARPIFLAGGERLGGVRIGFTLWPVQQKISEARRYTLSLGIIFALAGGILSAFVSRRLVRPIGELVRGTQLVASGDLDVKIPLSSRDELGLLADSFNRMAASLKQDKAALQRKVVETRTLYEIGQEIAAQIALDPILHLIVERARALLQAEISLLALRQEVSDTFAMQAYSGIVPEALAGVRFRPGEGLGGRVVATGTPIMVGDYVAEFADSPFLAIAQEAGLRSQVAVPLKAHNTVIGVLYAGSRVPHKFREEDRELLSALADQAAIAIENAKLYRDVKRHAEELEVKVEVRTRELQQANQQLEEASRHKSAFLANVSHELRTPLNAIIGFTRLVFRKTEGQIHALQKENLQKVLISAEHLLNLINGLLDLSKIEAGRMEVFVESFKLNEVLQVAASTVEPMLKDDVRLIKEIDQAIPSLNSDREKLEQIILNLLSNGAKFTEKGEIKVSAWQENGSLKLVVSDTGIGIEKEALNYIFEEFRQADMSSTRKHGGTGLGLAIVKKLVNLLGGEIGVESEVGKGSKFTITLPLNLKR
jgi:signal transduction histidine kinase